MLGRQGSSNSAFSMFGRRESDRDSRSSPRPLSATLGMALTPQRSRAVAPDEDPDNLMGQGWATSSVWSLWDTQHMEDWAASDARTAAALSEVVSREAIEEVFKPDGMTVRFKELQYTVKDHSKRGHKISLLHSVSGLLQPGEMTALMGPSGSGKTTLLDLLAGRKTVGAIKGTITFAGQRASKSFLRRYTGYVEQFDTLLENLTVHEMLMYTAEMKSQTSQPWQLKAAKVGMRYMHKFRLLLVGVVERQLNLTPCRHVRIGSALERGISGGQAKRVNIGIALVTNPRVLFLDEPTSGLDSYTADEVVEVVKDLARSGITICSTIHSPTPRCFSLFDHVLILLRGHLVYDGSPGKQALEFFSYLGGMELEAMQATRSIAECIVDTTTKADREGRAQELADYYLSSQLKASNDQLADKAGTGLLTPEMNKELAVRSATTTNLFFGWKTILKYRMLRDYTSRKYVGPRIGDKVLLGLIIMSLYWHAAKDVDNPYKVPNVAAVLFMASILPGFTASSYMPALVLERPLYYRELSDGMYRPITYLTAKITEELIMAAFSSLFFCCLTFFALELPGSFLLYFLVYYLTTCIGIVLAYFVAAVSPNMDVANSALPAYVVSLLFFVGLLIRHEDQPDYWSWYSYIDFLHYAWIAHMKNTFEHHNTRVIGIIPIMQYYSIGAGSKWHQLGFEFIFFVVFFVLAWAALAFVRHQKR